MKTKHLGLFCLLAGGLSFGITSLHKESQDPSKVRDTTFILELNQESLKDKELLKKEQDAVISTLNQVLGFNYRFVNSYSNALNAITINANSSVEEVLKQIPGVSKVVINREYRFGNIKSTADYANSEGYVANTSALSTRGIDVRATNDPHYPTNNHNYSADSMFVPKIGEGETAKVDPTNGEGTLIAVLDASFMINHSFFKPLSSPETAKYSKEEMSALIANPQLNAKAKKGAKPGEVGSLYHNDKIPFYFDYGGDSLNNYNSDFDTYSSYDAHGTHVATTAAGNGISGQGGNEKSYDGIAPGAQLALMKVFRETIPTNINEENAVSSGATDADVLAALEDCVLLGVDAINMSLGSDLDDFSSRSAAFDAIDILNNNGVSVNISAGNSGKDLFNTMGPYMYWTRDLVETGIIGSYANSASANIIASSTLEKQHFKRAISLEIEGQNYAIEYKDEAKTQDSTVTTPDNLKLESLVASNPEQKIGYVSGLGFGKATDYVDKDVKGKIAVVDRGETSFSSKASVAKEQGAVALIVVNNDPSAIEFTFGMAWGDEQSGYTYPEIPVVFVLNRDRSTLMRQEEGELTISLDKTLDNANKHKVSDFSSDGGTYDLRMNPTVTAPGTNILAGVPGDTTNIHGWGKGDIYASEYMSGTSMAAPNFSGAIATVKGRKYKEIDALNISEEEKAAKKLEYARTVTSRVMSTASIYTKDNTMITDKNTGASAVSEEDVPYSPRRQGAGVINATKAINSKVYLEGLPVAKDGTYGPKGTGTAKLELKNNDLVKKGIVNLEFLAHNETSKDVEYTAEVILTRPETKEYYNYESNHKVDEDGNIQTGTDLKFEGHIFQTNSNTVIKKVKQDITVKANSHEKISLNSISLTEEERKELDSLFENGTYLEGYVVLTPKNSADVANSYETLSIPFMGFYGDYEKGSAIEPFDFEKEEGKFYPSDLVNYVGTGTTLNLTDMNIGSMITTMSRKDYDALGGSTDLLTNKTNLKKFSNQITLNKETNTLYAGGQNSDVIYINAFVLRSVKSSKVTITNSLGVAVETSGDAHFRDAIYESKELYKSHVGQAFVGSGIIAHRAVCEIPLYDKVNVNNKLPDGNYKLKMEFELVSGSKQFKEYNLVIDSQIPEIVDRSIVTKTIDGADIKYLRIKYKETYLNDYNNGSLDVNVAVNGGMLQHELSGGNGTYYIDIKLDDIYALKDDATFGNLKLTLYARDGSYNETISMFYLDNFLEEAHSVMIKSDELTAGSSYSIRKDKDAEDTKDEFNSTYQIRFLDSEGNTLKLGESYEVTLTFKDPVDFNLITISQIDGKIAKAIPFTVVNSNTIKFELSNNSNKFSVTGRKGVVEVSEGNNLGLILGISIPSAVLLLAAGGVATFVLLKKKKSKKETE